MIHLILVDDQENIRLGLKMRLALESDIFVIGEASNGEQAIELARTLKPDVVIMDVEMPIMDGITAAQHIHEETGAKTSIVILSIHSDPQTRERAYAAGACAFVEKHGESDRLLSAVRQAASHNQRP